jgi:hypothetical protein
VTDNDFDHDVSKAHLEAAGWSLDRYFHANPFQCHVVYVRDYRTDHIQLFTIKRDDFDSIEVPFSTGELSAVLAELMLRLAGGRVSTKEAQALPQLLAAYVKGTQAYRVWRSQAGGHDRRLHAILNLYPGGSVRPFIARTSDTVIAADKLMADTDQVRAMDLANHPEWFAPR